MKSASLKPVIEELESLFSTFNKAFFEGKLEKPVITVSPDSTKGGGHMVGVPAGKRGRTAPKMADSMKSTCVLNI